MSWGTPLSTTVGASIAALRKTQLIPNFQFVRRMGGGEAPVQEFVEAAGQTFEAGQIVALDATGALIEGTAALEAILGIANKSATGVTGSVIPVTVGLQDVIFEALTDAPSAVALTNVGSFVDLVLDGSGNHLVDIGASTTDVFRVIGLPQGATTSTHPNYGKVFVHIQDSQVGQASLVI